MQTRFAAHPPRQTNQRTGCRKVSAQVASFSDVSQKLAQQP